MSTQLGASQEIRGDWHPLCATHMHSHMQGKKEEKAGSRDDRLQKSQKFHFENFLLLDLTQRENRP